VVNLTTIKYFINLFLIILLLSGTASAEQFIIEADGYHTASRKESISFAEKAATDDALKWAVEQIGIRISAYSEVVNKVIKNNEVERFSSSVIDIKNVSFTPKVVEDDYRIYAHVICVVDTSELDKWEPPDVVRQRMLEEDSNRLRNENQQLQREIENTNRLAEGERVRQIDLYNKQLRNNYKGPSIGMMIDEARRKLKGALSYENRHTQEAENMLNEAWNLARNNGFGDYCVLCQETLAALAWNRGDYNNFYALLLAATVENATGEHLWLDDIYSWVALDNNGNIVPRHNKKIDFRVYFRTLVSAEPKPGYGIGY